MPMCMFCEKRPAQEFGPYGEDDLICERCATDPREDHHRLVRGLIHALFLTGILAIVGWVVFWVAKGGW